MPVTNQTTPPLLSQFVDDGVSVEEYPARIINKMGAQQERMCSRISELEERFTLKEEASQQTVGHFKQEVHEREYG